MPEPVRKSVRLADGDMSYLEWPGAGAPLNFAHANGFNAETYKTILAPLADDFHVSACDQRGHGFSSLPTTAGLAKGWTVFRDDLIAYLDCIGDAPIVLAGHSMGATASFMAAAVVPEKVRALVLFEPVLMTAIARDNANPSPDLAARSLRRRASFASFEGARDTYRGRGIFKTWTDAMLEDYLRGGLKHVSDGNWELACPPVWESECFRETPLSIAGMAKDVRCPITIVHGIINSTTFPVEVEAVVKCPPDTRVVRVEGASHFLPMERPEIVREEIERTCRGL